MIAELKSGRLSESDLAMLDQVAGHLPLLADLTHADLTGAMWSRDRLVPDGWKLDTGSNRLQKIIFSLRGFGCGEGGGAMLFWPPGRARGRFRSVHTPGLQWCLSGRRPRELPHLKSTGGAGRRRPSDG